ncbi:MAG: class I lanthipeptide [Spirosomataceae bacterium]
MKKKNASTKLSLDKETIARLNEEQLSADQTQQVEGGATVFTAGASCCGIGKTGTYTSC